MTPSDWSNIAEPCDPKNEREAMEANSATKLARTMWASAGDADDIANRKKRDPSTIIDATQKGSVFWNRMLGLSDDGLRVIGKPSTELPA